MWGEGGVKPIMYFWGRKVTGKVWGTLFQSNLFTLAILPGFIELDALSHVLEGQVLLAPIFTHSQTEAQGDKISFPKYRVCRLTIKHACSMTT